MEQDSRHHPVGNKKGLDRNPAPFKIQYPMKNRYKDVKPLYDVA